MDVSHLPLDEAAVAVREIEGQGGILVGIDAVALRIDERFRRHASHHVSCLIHKVFAIHRDNHLFHIGDLNQRVDKGRPDQNLPNRVHIVVGLVEVHIHLPGFQDTVLYLHLIRQGFHMVASHLGTAHFFQKLLRHLSR